jgi:transposase
MAASASPITPPNARCAALPSAARNWLFAGSDRGGERAAAMYTLIVTAKLNNVDPQAWLDDVLCRIADHPARRLHELLPGNRQKPAIAHTAAA